mgnify:CR=1 FL=1
MSFIVIIHLAVTIGFTSLPSLSVTHNLLIDVLGAPGPVGHQHDAVDGGPLRPSCHQETLTPAAWVTSLTAGLGWYAENRLGYYIGYLLPGPCPVPHQRPTFIRRIEWG